MNRTQKRKKLKVLWRERDDDNLLEVAVKYHIIGR